MRQSLLEKEQTSAELIVTSAALAKTTTTSAADTALFVRTNDTDSESHDWSDEDYFRDGGDMRKGHRRRVVR